MRTSHGLPKRGYAGLILIVIGWPLTWIRPAGIEFLWENAFLFLWGGYALIADALNWKKNGTSLFSRSPKAYVGLFLLSIPGWWLFEFFNIFLQNWHYIHNRSLGTLEYAIRSSIHFSIVFPVVLTTAELWASSRLLRRTGYWKNIEITRPRLMKVISAGLIMTALVIILPRFFFPFVWIGLYLIFDSINMMRGAPSILLYISRGNWRPPLALALGALTCGIFWEMWNFYALPKWVYTVPFVNSLHIFEMPALGYLDYLPFGLEVYALYVFIIDFCGFKRTFLYGGDDYIRLD